MSLAIGATMYRPNYNMGMKNNAVNNKQVGFKGWFWNKDSKSDIELYKEHLGKIIEAAKGPEDDDLAYIFNGFYEGAMYKDPITATRETWLAGEKLAEMGLPEDNWARQEIGRWGKRALETCDMKKISREFLQQGYTGKSNLR